MGSRVAQWGGRAALNEMLKEGRLELALQAFSSVVPPSKLQRGEAWEQMGDVVVQGRGRCVVFIKWQCGAWIRRKEYPSVSQARLSSLRNANGRC